MIELMSLMLRPLAQSSKYRRLGEEDCGSDASFQALHQGGITWMQSQRNI
jgi:hypothetical protein